ncbi:MAG TPA: glycosyltransferase family 9 protein [Verrucomicrobiae bacterium]|nr:glycosyltransferase family 9 protein [Verrucomicrobiae bacterium]
MSSPRGKILVIRGGAIGDFILTLPAIAALRQQFPEVHLEVLGYPHIVQLAEAGGLVNRVQAIEARGLAGFFARNGELSEDLCDYFSDFNIIVSYLYDPDEIFKMNIARCSPAQFIVGPHRPDEAADVHATEAFLKPLERLAIFGADQVPHLSLVVDESIARHAPTIALHPGSGSERKNWSETNWTRLFRELIDQSTFNLLLVGGEAEGDRLANYARVLPAERVRVARSLPLKELARQLKDCAGFIGHDSGITHLAAAVGLPTLALWAETNMDIWRPLGNNVVLLQGETGIESLPISRVLEQVLNLRNGKRFEPDRSRPFRWRASEPPAEFETSDQ